MSNDAFDFFYNRKMKGKKSRCSVLQDDFDTLKSHLWDRATIKNDSDLIELLKLFTLLDERLKLLEV